MRKRLKIKASILIIAWMVVFLHDVIPHNHSEEEAFRHTRTYDITLNTHHSLSVRAYKYPFSHHSNRECHFSANLFAKFSLENFDALPSGNFRWQPDILQGIINNYSEVQQYISPHVKWYSMRAPPSFC